MGIMSKYQIEKIDKFNRYKICNVIEPETLQEIALNFAENSKEALIKEPFAIQGD